MSDSGFQEWSECSEICTALLSVSDCTIMACDLERLIHGRTVNVQVLWYSGKPPHSVLHRAVKRTVRSWKQVVELDEAVGVGGLRRTGAPGAQRRSGCEGRGPGQSRGCPQKARAAAKDFGSQFSSGELGFRYSCVRVLGRKANSLLCSFSIH